MNQARKLIAAVMAIYMMALILIPCCDNCDSHEHLTSTSFQITQDNHEEKSEICSPFCNCSCCAIHITLLHPTEFATLLKIRIREFTPFKQSFLSSFSDDCWQPPRLV